MHAAVAPLIHPEDRVRRVLARLPLPVLLVAPAAIVLAISAITPALTRFGFALDLEIYRVYAVDVLAGLAPYRDVPIEYPPLAIVPMVIPLIGAPAGLDALGYLWRFAAIEATILVWVGWLVHRLSGGALVGAAVGTPGGARGALGLWAVLAGLSWVAILFRYDIWPVATMVGAALLADRRRPGVAGVALGVGTMLKLFPAALLPILAMHALVRRDGWGVLRLAVGWAAVVAIVQGAAWLVAGPDSLDWLRYQADRGLQVESLGAGILLGLNLLTGYPVEASYGYGAVEVTAAAAPLLASISPVAMGLLVAAAAAITARRFGADQRTLGHVATRTLGLACLAVLTGLLVGSKVLSFQYILWLLPFAPVLALRGRWLVVVIAGLSTWIYTWHYVGLWDSQVEVILGLVARNVLLLWLMAEVLRELWNDPSRPAMAQPT